MKSRFKSKPFKKTHRTLSELDFINLWISIRGANGSQPWVGRSTAQMNGNPNMDSIENIHVSLVFLLI